MKWIRDKIVKIYGFGLIDQALTVVFSILSYRVLLSVYGVEKYGALVITSSIAGLISFFELGTGRTVYKYVAIFYKEKDLASAGKFFNSMLSYKSQLFFITLIVFLIFNLFPQLFFKSEVLLNERLMTEIHRLFIITTVVASINYFMALYISLANAFFLTDKIIISRIVLYALSILYLLVLNSGMIAPSIIIYYFIISCFGLIPFLTAVFYTKNIFRNVKKIQIKKISFGESFRKEVKNFRNVSYLGALAFTLFTKTDEIIISRFLSLTVLPIFVIGKRIYAQLYSLNKVFAEPLTNLSIIYSDANKRKYLKMGTLMYSLMSFFFSGLILSSADIICRDIFKNYNPQAVTILISFCLAYQFSVVGMVMNRFLYINGFHKILTFAPFILAVLKVTALVLFIGKFGLILVPVVILIYAVILDIVRFYLLIKNKIFDFYEVFKIYLKALSIPMTVLSIIYLLKHTGLTVFFVNPYISLFINSTIFAFLFAAVSFLAINTSERKILKNFFLKTV